MSRLLFTTSWDDGYAADERVASLLSSHGLTGTFYLCPRRQHRAEMLGEAGIARLGIEHEIGAHTLTHPRLTSIPAADAAREIRESKRWVEERTGRDCAMFCYPYGDTNDHVQSLVRDAGFRGARTVEILRFDHGTNPFLLPTSIQIAPVWRQQWTRWWHPLDPWGWVRKHWRHLSALGVPITARTGWLRLATWLFDDALRRHQPVFHLWGHSREIERNCLWDDLEAFLRHVAQKREQITPVTNSGLLAS